MDSATPPLSTALWRLIRRCCDEVKARVAQGEMRKVLMQRYKQQVNRFTNERGSLGWGAQGEITVHEEWDTSAKYAVTEHLKPTPEYVRVVEAIIAEAELHDKVQAENLVSTLLLRVIDDCLAGTEEDRLVDLLTLFVDDIRERPVWWSIRAWLDGVWLSSDRIEIEPHLRLKDVTKSDVEEFLASRGGLWFTAIHERPTSTIMELRARGSTNLECLEAVDTALDLLRLYRLGSVVANQTEQTPRSVTRVGGRPGAVMWQVPAYRYGIGSDDCPELRKFAATIRPLLAPYTRFHDRVFNDPFAIGFQRYKDALLSANYGLDARVTSAITCWEALYLGAQERTELSHRLAQRVASLLQLVEPSTIQIARDIKHAYDIRSTFIHGAVSAEQGKADRMSVLAERVLNLARKSLLMVLQLQQDVEKEDLLSKLDNALLHSKSRERLWRLIENTVIT